MTTPDATVTTAIVGDLRQSLQVILTSHGVLARSVRCSGERVQLALIKGAEMRMADTLDRLPVMETVAGSQSTLVSQLWKRPLASDRTEPILRTLIARLAALVPL
jgi:hypothetical protein